MNDLNAAFRMLVEAGPLEAPDHVEIALKESFRRHHRARRLRRGIVVTIAAGAAAASLAVFARIPQPPVPPAQIVLHIPPPAMAWENPCGPGTHACRAETRLGAPSRQKARRAPPDQLSAAEFVPLPYGDDALVGESARIVRVELPRSALRMAGFSVAQERANDRVEADVVLGADGLAHAVRFVRFTE